MKKRALLTFWFLLNERLGLAYSVCVPWLQVNANGSVMSSDIVGSIKLKTMLSGMPELRLGLNDRVLFALTGREFKASFFFLTMFKRIYNHTHVHIHTGLHAAFRWQRQDGGDGGRQVPPVRSALALWERPNHLLHSSRRGVWAHVLPHQHPCSSTAVVYSKAFTWFFSFYPIYGAVLCFLLWQVKPLIWIESVIEKFSHSRVEIMVKVATLFLISRKNKSYFFSGIMAIYLDTSNKGNRDRPNYPVQCLTVPSEKKQDWTFNKRCFYALSTFQAKGQFKRQSVANNVEVRVPVPSDADSPKFKTSTGNAKYVPEKNLVVWTIKSFPVRSKCSHIPWTSTFSNAQYL